MNTIKNGDRVRSFDFDSRDLTGERACYVEGTVVRITTTLGDRVLRYVIAVDRDVCGGTELSLRLGTEVCPPVNGTPKLFGGVADGVQLIRQAD